MKLVTLHLSLKISAVQKRHRVAAARIFVRLPSGHNHHRIVLMAGGSPAACDYLRPVRHRRSLHIALHRMAAIKTDQIKVPADPVQTCGLRFLQIDLTRADVLNAGAPGENIQLRKHTVKKSHLHLRGRIFQVNLQRLRLILTGIHRRESRQAVLSFHDTVPCIAEVTAIGTVRILYNDRNAPVIPRRLARQLLRQHIHRIRAVLIRIVGIP